MGTLRIAAPRRPTLSDTRAEGRESSASAMMIRPRPSIDCCRNCARPFAMRDMMMAPVRACYRGRGLAIDPAAAARAPRSSIRRSCHDSRRSFGRRSDPLRMFHAVWRRPMPMMLVQHGRRLCVGRSEDTAYVTSRIAAENNVIVVSANYRWAPEWALSAALDDCMSVLRWMRDRGADIGGDASRILVCGDSAGGNLATALPIRGREEHLSILATVLLCPVTDFHFRKICILRTDCPDGRRDRRVLHGIARGAYLTRNRSSGGTPGRARRSAI